MGRSGGGGARLSLVVPERGSLPRAFATARSDEDGPECRDSAQMRTLGFKGIGAVLQPFHVARKMSGFVNFVVENRVGECVLDGGQD